MALEINTAKSKIRIRAPFGQPTTHPARRVLLVWAFLATTLGGVELSAQIDCAVQSEVPPSECEALVSLWRSTGGSGWGESFGWAETDSPCSWFGVGCSSGHVRELVLRSNNLVGQIPLSLGDLSGLRVLDLGFNVLSAAIPQQLGQLRELAFLLLDGNFLSGPIPPDLGELKNLELLTLEGNRLSGGIPPQLQGIANLLELRLGDNRLSGPIPPELGNLGTVLSVLSLRGNLLEGTLPPSLSALAGLTTLDLSRNDLEGALPPELGQLSSLTQVDLGHNLLSGEVPAEVLDLSQIVAGGFAIPFNCLTATEPAVRAFLDFASPGWEATQCTRVFDDGFERGDLSRWSSNSR